MAEKALIGGLLGGFGEGMIAQGQQRHEAEEAERERRREEAAALREAALERAKEMRERRFEQQQAEAEHERKSGLLSTTKTDAQGRLIGVTKGGEAKPLGVQMPLEEGEGGSGTGGGSGGGDEIPGIEMTAGEKRTYEEVKARYTNPNTNQIDWQGLIGHLRDMPDERGGDRWNEIADYLVGSVGQRMSREEAREQAVQEANQRKGYLTSRENEFPETGGDQQAWIQMRTKELMGGEGIVWQQPGGGQQQTGGRGLMGGGSRQQRPQAKSGQKASQPPGKGTENAPYKASTQAHIDWFLENAPAGAVIEANGQLYTK